MIEIRTDDDALALLTQLTADPDSPVPEVDFVGWPKFELHVKGERYHSTITPELMSSFLTLQKHINKSYALVKYADSNRRLKEQDREDLKILVEVGEGSSGFIATLEAQVDKMGTALAEGVKDMDSKQKLVAILSIGLMVFGAYSVDTYLDNKKEVRLAEISLLENEAEREERLKTLQIMQQTDVQHTAAVVEMFNKIADNQPQLITASEHIASAYDEIIASTKDAESIEIQGRHVAGSVVNELSNSPRNKSIEDRISGVYRIQNVDHSNKDDYRFKLLDVTRNQDIFATLPKDGSMVTDQILDLLQEAEWGRKVVALRLITKKRSGKVVKAEIEKVSPVDDQDKYVELIGLAD